MKSCSAIAVSFLVGLVSLATAQPQAPFGSAGLERVKFNHPGLTVDLGVGLWAWPLPMDFDGDGDLDLVVSCSDVPFNGTYVFENPSPGAKLPVFLPPRRISRGLTNVQISYVGSGWRILTPATEHPGFLKEGLDGGAKLSLPDKIYPGKLRANQWKYVDYDGDGLLDLVVGVGDWGEYGWDNAYNGQGQWTNGPLHGYVFWLRNVGTAREARYAPAERLMAGGGILDVYGMPSPNFADFDGDGDLDLVCGEFVDTLTYFENIGSRRKPRYAAGRKLRTPDGQTLTMDLCMIVPVAIDWDKDGDVDLVIGQEDGRVALVENTGQMADRTPVFLTPQFFRQAADNLKFGALATPVSFDWDGDGDEDLVCGNSAGYIGFIENLDGGNPPRWAAARYLEVDGRPIRILAGPNGSIQGPAEAKWGYTVLSVADWDHDALPDLVVNSIWGAVVWYRNLGPRNAPRLAEAQPIEVQWSGATPKPRWTWWSPKGRQLVTQWRTTPAVLDVTGDGLNDLVMLDQEGFLSLFERRRQGDRLVLAPPKRVYYSEGKPLQLNAGEAGRSGRRKLCFADWDRDGHVDLLLNSRNTDFLRNVSAGPDRIELAERGLVDELRLAGHTTCPTVVDWDRNGVPDLLVGAEDGHFYYMKNPNPDPQAKAPAGPPEEHLVAKWDFENAAGGVLADKAAKGVAQDNLTALGKAYVQGGAGIVPTVAGSAFQAQSSHDLSPTEEMTIWARLRVDEPPRGIMSLVDKRSFRDPESRSYGLYIMSSGPGFGVGGQVSANGTARQALAGRKAQNSLPLRCWCQVAMVVGREGRRLVAQWYGRRDCPPDPPGPWQSMNGPETLPSIDRIYRNRIPLLIGNDVGLRAPAVTIEFDEVRIYNRALTADEMR